MPEQSDQQFLFIGNHLCLDFVNTKIVQEGRPVDFLNGFTDFLSWLVQANVVDPGEAKARTEAWGGTPEAGSIFARARDFRDTTYHMVRRIVEKRSVPDAAVFEINTLLRNQAGHGELKRAKGGFEKRFQVDFKQPIHLLGPLAESACDLLAYGDLSLVKKCENPACVLFFYDTTKNHSRRWCSMSACGNRMKVAAHYRRLRASGPT